MARSRPSRIASVIRGIWFGIHGPGPRRSSAAMPARPWPWTAAPWRGPRPPPGMPTLPVSAGRQPTARPAVQPLAPLCMLLPPSTIIAGRVVAYCRASATIRSAGTPVIGAAQAGGCEATCARRASKPSVWPATNSRSHRRSATITCISASASAASLPGRTRTTSSACAAASVSRTSSVTTRAPRRRAAARWRAVFGCEARLAPHRRISAAWAPRSSFVLTSSTPVRPRPKPPRPQQIIVGFHHWQPHRLANRRSSCEATRVP